MQSVNQYMTKFSKQSDTDQVFIEIRYVFDNGQEVAMGIHGSDADLIAHAQANGKFTWDEQDIAQLYTLDLTPDTASKLTEVAQSYQVAQVAIAAAAAAAAAGPAIIG
jgi:hypothetical protein